MKIEKIDSRIAAHYLGQLADHVGVNSTQRAIPINTTSISDVAWGIVSLVPHLRRLESLTEEEARELCEISHGAKFPQNGNALTWWHNPVTLDYTNKEAEVGSPAVWLKLLEWGIDLFGLIDAGLAKDVVRG